MKVIELKVPKEGGANGAGIVWHPIQKKYYAAMAGNKSFSLAVFDEKGHLLSSPDQSALLDVRGLWYNSKTKTIQANGYDAAGWWEYQLDNKGMPTSIKELKSGKNQPDAQSCGAYDSK